MGVGGMVLGEWNFTLHEYRINYLPAPILLSLLSLYRRSARVSNSDCSLMFEAQVRRELRRRKKSCETKEVKLIIKSMNIRETRESFLCFSGRKINAKAFVVVPHPELLELAQRLSPPTTRHRSSPLLKLPSTSATRGKFVPLIN